MLFFKHKRNKRTAYALIIAGILLVFGIILLIIDNLSVNNKGLQICPDEMIVNEMPGIDRSGETTNDVEATRSSYYILNGERREIDEFDTAYIAENCTVPVQSVY